MQAATTEEVGRHESTDDRIEYFCAITIHLNNREVEKCVDPTSLLEYLR